ncbi:thiamine diphosphokinase [Peloplasma aerotolerans]|uniref:Thiamine diphosphokinase n=1 Tax=Peloplasma aerotolerans TaxID=3044389 RepID=A0AAW6U6P8_9MOLU|nr:thiamine diphosphokinase [Mariniplasma sp. M4Ah]MDI6453557.1 thiamine diphosphokinase [Mariniplasma sp. M4Ah]
MRAIIVTHPTPKDIKKIFPLKDSDYIIAVDQAVLSLYKQRIKIDLAVGDFDSLQNHGILTNLNVVRLNPVKDVTDTHQALVEASKLNADELYLIGGIGGERIEHFMVHTMFFNEFPEMIIKDDHSTIYLLDKGVHEISNNNHYVSIFAYPRAKVSLTGFKYDLTEYLLTTYDPLCISNELNEHKGFVEVFEGKALVVISKKS